MGGNTLLLFVRTVIVTLCGAVAVRLAIAALGVDGYGTYATAMGVVGLFMLFKGALEQTARRFVSHEFGLGASGDVQAAFSSVLLVSLALVAFLLVLGETVGLWFVRHVLSVPPDGARAVVVAYQFGLLVSSAALLTVPFAALISADERMAFFVVAGAVGSTAALVAAGVASVCPRFGRETYAATLAAGEIASLALHVVFCRVRFPHVRVSARCPVARLRGTAAFLGWGALSSVGNALKYRGTSILVNRSFGVAFNASWDVALKVWDYIHSFCADFMQAFSPPIFKSWAAKKRGRMASLAAWTTLVSALIAAFPAAIVFTFAPAIVGVWLGDGAPPQVVAFVRCSALNVVFDAASNPLTTAILATGRVKLYQTVACAFSLAGFASAGALLAAGQPAWTAMAAVAASNGGALAYRYLHVRLLMGLRPSFAVLRASSPESAQSDS